MDNKIELKYNSLYDNDLREFNDNYDVIINNKIVCKAYKVMEKMGISNTVPKQYVNSYYECMFFDIRAVATFSILENEIKNAVNKYPNNYFK